MISKRKFINTLFVLAFPWFGIGSYLIMREGFSIGLIWCIIPFVTILLFHVLDLIYRGTFIPVVNGTFFLCLAAILSMVISVPIGLHYHSPMIDANNSLVLATFLITPYLATVVVQVYNRGHEEFDMSWMIVRGLIALLLVNILGYAAGLRNLLHSFEDRLSPPFALGVYDMAHTLAFMCLILLGYMAGLRKHSLRTTGTWMLFLFTLAVMFSLNSRLSIMIFIVVSALFVTRAMRVAKGLFTISLFTLPIMMSFALLIYEILSLPFFASILGRVSKEDVTTFNGRTYIWEAAWDWITKDGRGLLVGNGFNGQYHLHMLDGVAKLWGVEGSYRLHMHSTSLEVLVNQGLVGLVLMCLVLWRAYRYYRQQYLDRTSMAPLFAGVVYLLFIWQIDIYGYAYNTGYLFLFMLMAPLSIKPCTSIEKSR